LRREYGLSADSFADIKTIVIVYICKQQKVEVKSQMQIYYNIREYHMKNGEREFGAQPKAAEQAVH
jgi:hypothetical protein